MFKIRNKIRNLPQILPFVGRLYLDRIRERRSSRPGREAEVLEYVRRNAESGSPRAVLQAMDDYARSHRWLMNIGPVKGEILARALRESTATRMLEIGAYCGYSAVLAGGILAARNGRLHSVEKSRRNADIARQVIAHAGLAEHVVTHTGTLSEHLGSFAEPFDVVLLDHWKDEYLPDLRRLEQAGLLRPGSIVVADNIEFFDVPEYLRHVRESGHYTSKFHAATVEYQEGIPDGVEVSVYLGGSGSGSGATNDAQA